MSFSARISSNMHHYTNSELVGIHFMHVAEQGNRTAVRTTYMEKFPDMNAPDYKHRNRTAVQTMYMEKFPDMNVPDC